MNDVRFEYNYSWMDAMCDWVHVIGMLVSARARSSCRCGLIVTVAEVLDHISFIANLIKSRGTNQMIF